MSRWPPEIAGTISHPAGRSAVTAERVPIFYSARSSSPSFHPRHSLSLFSAARPPSTVCTGVSVCWPDTTSRREWTGAVSTPKRRTKGVVEDGRMHERKQMPRQPRLIYTTLYPVLLFLISSRPLTSEPLTPSPTTLFPPFVYFRTTPRIGSVHVDITRRV